MDEDPRENGPAAEAAPGTDAGNGAEAETGTAVRRGRFSGGPARGFLSSLAADERIFAADLAVDRAHVVMLAEQGIVEDADAADVLEALDVVEVEGHGSLPDGEDVHEAIESKVIELAGAVGGTMHTARSRNDEVATCIRHRYRADLLAAVEATLAFRAALLDVAAAHTETVMPGFTHLQPAQPTTVTHWALSYESALTRDTARLLDAFDRTNRSALGAAAFAGTPFDVDRDRTAELLGFDGVVENAMDAVSARDFLVEGTSALAGVATTLSGVADDLVVYANKGYVVLDDDYASTSSIMPQKKNPDSLELVRATAGQASAGLNGLLATLKGLPRAYNRDLQRAHPHAFGVADAVTEATEVAAGAVATADWPADALEAAAAEGFSTATGVADLLAMAGVPFRTAHEIVAEAGALLDGATADYDAVAAAAGDVLDEQLSTYVSRERVEAALDPAESVAMRDSLGGPAPEAVAAAIERASEAYDEDEATHAARADALDASREQLTEVVHQYA